MVGRENTTLLESLGNKQFLCHPLLLTNRRKGTPKASFGWQYPLSTLVNSSEPLDEYSVAHYQYFSYKTLQFGVNLSIIVHISSNFPGDIYYSSHYSHPSSKSTGLFFLIRRCINTTETNGRKKSKLVAHLHGLHFYNLYRLHFYNHTHQQT